MIIPLDHRFYFLSSANTEGNSVFSLPFQSTYTQCLFPKQEKAQATHCYLFIVL